MRPSNDKRAGLLTVGWLLLAIILLLTALSVLHLSCAHLIDVRPVIPVKS